MKLIAVMKKITASVVFAAVSLGGFLSSAQAEEQPIRTAKISSCLNMSKSELAAMVKRDFLQNRITRWDVDKKLLGTSKPVVWITPESIQGDSTNWSIPVKVRGGLTDRTYPVTLNCQSGEIDYGIPQ